MDAIIFTLTASYGTLIVAIIISHFVKEKEE